MFGKFVGNILAAPLRAVVVVADYFQEYDCLDIAELAENAADNLQEDVEYILGD